MKISPRNDTDLPFFLAPPSPTQFARIDSHSSDSPVPLIPRDSWIAKDVDVEVNAFAKDNPSFDDVPSKYATKQSLWLFLHYFKTTLGMSAWCCAFLFIAVLIPLQPVNSSKIAPNLGYFGMMFCLAFWAGMPRATGVFYVLGEPKRFQTTGALKHVLPYAKYWSTFVIPVMATLLNLLPFGWHQFPIPFAMVMTPALFAFLFAKPLALLNYPKEIRHDKILMAKINTGMQLYSPSTLMVFFALLFIYVYFNTPPYGGGILRALVIAAFQMLGFLTRYVIYKMALRPATPKILDPLARYYVTVLIYLSTTFVLPSGTTYFIYIAFLAAKALTLVIPLLICTKWVATRVGVIKFMKYEIDHQLAVSEAINLFVSHLAVVVCVVIFVPFSLLITYGYNKQYTFYYSFDEVALLVTNLYVICDMIVTTLVFALCRRYFQRHLSVDPLAMGLHNIKTLFWQYCAVTMVGTVFLVSIILRQTDVIYLFLPQLYGTS